MIQLSQPFLVTVFSLWPLTQQSWNLKVGFNQHQIPNLIRCTLSYKYLTQEPPRAAHGQVLLTKALPPAAVLEATWARGATWRLGQEDACSQVLNHLNCLTSKPQLIPKNCHFIRKIKIKQKTNWGLKVKGKDSYISRLLKALPF